MKTAKAKTQKVSTSTTSTWDVKNELILVALNISMWSGRKFDKKVTAEVEKRHKTGNAGRFNKILIQSEGYMKELTKIAGQARTFFYDNTLPWGKNNYILTAQNYITFTETIADLSIKFQTALNGFLETYPAQIEEAMERLKTLFNRNEYPPLAEITRKFSFGVSYMPIGDPNDIRLRIASQDREELMKTIKNEMEANISEAVNEMMNRAKEHITGLVTKLKEKDPIFRDSLIGNIKELIDLFPKLNFTGDAKIAALCEEMKELLVDPENLRNDNKVKKMVVSKAEKLLNQYF